MTNTVAPYCMTNDNGVMMIFVMNIIGMAYVFLMNGAGIMERLKCMFYYESKSTPFNNRTHITRICNILMYIQTLFYSTILASKLILEKGLYRNGTTILPLAGVLALLFIAVLLIKIVGYNAVNAILFDRRRIIEWRDFYLFTIKLLGFALTPAILAVLFMPGISIQIITFYLFFVLFVYVYTLFTGVIKIIFAQKRNYLDIFLYLCALEFLPMGIVWKLTLQASGFLTIKN